MPQYAYPPTRRDLTISDNFHGVTIADPYRFLEDPDSEETKQFVDEQNKVTNAFLEKCQYRSKIQERITSLWNYPKFGSPFKRGDFYYFFKNTGLQNQSVLYQQDTLESEDAREFLDPNKFAEDGTTALQQAEFSEDGKLLAYIVCEKGSDWGRIHFKDVATGEVLEDRLENVKFSCLSWTHDNAGVFYNQFPKSLKSDGTSIEKNEFQQLCYHRVGTKQSDDVVVAQFLENSNWMGHAEVSDCGNYVFMSISQSCDPTNQLWYYDLRAADFRVTPHLEFVKLINNFDSKWDYITNEGSVITCKTNESGALKYKLVTCDLKEPQWKTLVAETEDVLQTVAAFDNDKLILNYMHDCKDELYLFDLKTGEQLKKFAIDIGTVMGIDARKKDSSFFFKHTSFTSPGDIYLYKSGADEPLVFRRSAFSGIDLTQFETEQVFYTSKDGTRIPMFLVAKKGVLKTENNPTILYAYGGFNISLTPTFSVTRLTWLQNFNGVYAIANIRGGGEYGEAWYNAGRLFNKQNCFDDFCCAAEYLIKEKITSSDRLVINGGSNGGLLVTACINQRPELFFAAIADVGVCDMLRFHKFTIGSYWVSDYGCADKKEDFEYMIKYSPVHSIKKGAKYPYVLLATADHDDRVVPSHSYKYISELQHQNGDQERPFLIRIETKAGHGAGKPTAKVIQEYSDKFGYLAEILGLEWQD